MSRALAASKESSASVSLKSETEEGNDRGSPASGTREPDLMQAEEPPVRLGASTRGTRELTGIQPKLTVNEPGDKYEGEAERVADAMMRMPEPEERHPRSFDRIRDSASGRRVLTDEAVARQIESVTSGGKPLPPAARSFFEPRFGRDFEDVRIHTGREADEAARSIDAEAFTHGRNVVFRSGAYEPEWPGGKRLLAHELTHIVQQDGGSGNDRIQQQPEQEASKGTGESTSTTDRMGTGPLGLTGSERVELFNRILTITNSGLAPFLFVLDQLGYQVNMGGIGLRYSGHATPPEGGPAVGAGVEGLFVFDPAQWQVEADVVPFAEVGAGFGAGAGIDILLALQVGTPAEAGGEKEMGGASFAAELNAIVGAGVWVSESLNKGNEGWIVFNVGLGAELSAKATAMASRSGGKAIDAIAKELGLELLAEINLLGEQLPLAEIEQRTEGEAESGPGEEQPRGRIADVFELALLGGSHALTSPWRPSDWTFLGEWKREEKMILRSFGREMRIVATEKIRNMKTQGVENAFEKFWTQENTGSKTVRDRLGSKYDFLLKDVIDAANAVATRKWDGDVLELELFNERSYLQILRLLEDAELLTTYGATEEPLRRTVSE